MTNILDYLKAKGVDTSKLMNPDEVTTSQGSAEQLPSPTPGLSPSPADLQAPAPVQPAIKVDTGPFTDTVTTPPIFDPQTHKQLLAAGTNGPTGPVPASVDPEEDDSEDGTGPGTKTKSSMSVSGHMRADPAKQALQAAISGGGFTNNTVEGLKAAQDKAAHDTALDSIFRAVGNISGGLAGMGAHSKAPDQTENNKFYDLQDKAAAQGVTDFQARGEQEKNDPKAALSVNARQFAAPLLAKLGMNLPENVSYAGMEKLNPQLTKLYDAQEAREAKSSDLQYKYAMLNEMKKQGQQTKDALLSDKLGKQLETAIDPDQARAGNFAKSKAVLNSADRVNALFEQFPDYNIPKSQTVELATATAAMISGGSPQSQAQIEHLIPSSVIARGKDGISEWLGTPQGREQQEFMRMMHDTAKREADVAREQILTTQLQRIAAHNKLKQIDPDNYNGILERRGIDQETINDFIKNKGKLTPKKNKEKLTTTGEPKTGHAPGDIVDVKGKQYRIGADGDSLEPL